MVDTISPGPVAREQQRRAALLQRVLDYAGERIDELASTPFEQFLTSYYASVPLSDLEGCEAVDLYGAALSHWQLAEGRPAGELRIRVSNPDHASSGWRSSHTVLEIVADDMPFIVDSVVAALGGLGLGVHLLVHVAMRVARDREARITECVPVREDGAEGAIAEAFLHIEVDRVTDASRLAEIEERASEVLAEVRVAVEDWQVMQDRAGALVDDLEGWEPAAAEEARELLRWMVEDHFTFLGCVDFAAGDEGPTPDPSSALGVLRRPGHLERVEPPPLDGSTPLYVTKGRERSSIARAVRFDEVWAARLGPDGQARGWSLIVGLFGVSTYVGSVLDVPVVRHKVEAVLDGSPYERGSHGYNRLLAVLEQYPRDELFEIGVEELEELAAAIAALRQQSGARLLVRRDDRGRFHSCLVFLPRDHYTTEIRRRVQRILSEEFGSTDLEYTAQVAGDAHARLHYLVHHATPVPTPDVAAVEARVQVATRDWVDSLRMELLEAYGEERGVALFTRYRDAFTHGYRDIASARTALADIGAVERLPEGDGLDVQVRHRPEEPADVWRLRLYASGRDVSLSMLMPILQNLGGEVLEEQPYEVRPLERLPVSVYEFTLRLPHGLMPADDARELLAEALSAVWRGEVDNDPLNRLTLVAGLGAREVMLVRTLVRYARQLGVRFSEGFIADTLLEHPKIAAQLVELFARRHDPDAHDPSEDRVASLREQIASVESLDQDLILRLLLAIVLATLRTNYFRRDEEGQVAPYIALKLAPSMIPDAPAPRPAFEIFVFGPRVEALHLRSGPVARGGIRWSDRREDLRTEILGLMHTQTAKNAVIVPVGAKGGFIVRRPPADRDALQAEAVACYRMLISGLLDLTDNMVGGEIVPPERVVRYDGDDAYLVVAADKGTATFSDIANELALARGFWLGDAFASGGSEGYDHKRMGITARGAWESVKRHFRELGVDVQSEPVCVVGIGDMSGDVFGNGMLASRALRLVAAFDHRHVFIDPNPDPERSYAERQRLYDLPGSSWEDYDRTAISPGGGVYARSAKSIPLSGEARAALGTDAEALTPTELVSTVLRAPVDLLWNGGIGTFVKASTESDADAGDRANDDLRVDATELRCRVIGEGGNLGLTQAARVEFALGGGRVYTDFIDNSAGVDTSDHEVNIKILLDRAVAGGDLTAKQRHELLTTMADDVAADVLRNNYDQTGAISTAYAQAHLMVDVHRRQLAHLEGQIGLDRALEGLPADDVLAERRALERGLQPPELAVLLAYTKIWMLRELLASTAPEDPWFGQTLAAYFPPLLRERFASEIAAHPLRRELIATLVTNHLVSRAGTSMVHRMVDETSATVGDIARAHHAAWYAFEMPGLWAQIAALDLRVVAPVQTAMMLECRRLAERGTRWFLRNRRPPLDIASAIEAFRGAAAEVAADLPQLLQERDRERFEQRAQELLDDGVTEETARRIAGLPHIVSVLDIVDIAGRTRSPVHEVATVYFLLDDRVGFSWLRDRVVALPRNDRWEALARSALRDDLVIELAALTAQVVEACQPDEQAPDLVERWIAHNSDALTRARALLDDVRGLGHADLAHLTVALREMRNLLHQASSPLTA